MAEGINRMTPEELMLVDSYEAMVEMLGIETPIEIAAKIAAFRNGKPMLPNEKRELSQQAIQLGQQAKDMGLMPTTQLSGKQESVPSPDPLAANTSTPSISSTSTDGTVMGLEELIAAGIVTPPTRPQARPMMTSPRPQARPTAPMQSPRPQMRR